MAASFLVVRFGALGDVVLSFALGAALKRAHPEARVTYLVKAEYAPLVEAQPWSGEVWALGAGEERGATALPAWRARVREASFDAAIDLQTSPRSRAILAGSPRVLAWKAERLARRRWVSLRWTRPSTVRPAWLRFLDAARPLGVDPDRAAAPALALPAAAHASAERWFAAWPAASERAPILLAPGARWATKRWPEASWIALADALEEEGHPVLVAGDSRDRDALPKLAERAQGEGEVRWFVGSLEETAAAISRCPSGVTNDSGLMHVAAALGVRLVALFGSTHPGLGFPPAGEGHVVLCRALSCQPCTLHGRDDCPLGHHRCMRDLSPTDVGNALRSVISADGAARIRG